MTGSGKKLRNRFMTLAASCTVYPRQSNCDPYKSGVSNIDCSILVLLELPDIRNMPSVVMASSFKNDPHFAIIVGITPKHCVSVTSSMYDMLEWAYLIDSTSRMPKTPLSNVPMIANEWASCCNVDLPYILTNNGNFHFFKIPCWRVRCCYFFPPSSNKCFLVWSEYSEHFKWRHISWSKKEDEKSKKKKKVSVKVMQIWGVANAYSHNQKIYVIPLIESQTRKPHRSNQGQLILLTIAWMFTQSMLLYW